MSFTYSLADHNSEYVDYMITDIIVSTVAYMKLFGSLVSPHVPIIMAAQLSIEI